MRWYAQDEVNQEESGHNEVDGMKTAADSIGNVMHTWKSGWWFVMRKIRVVEFHFDCYRGFRNTRNNMIQCFGSSLSDHSHFWVTRAVNNVTSFSRSK